MKRTTLEALGGAQGVPSDLIPVRKLHAHLIRQSVAGNHAHLIRQSVAGNIVLTDVDAKPAAVVMLMHRYHALLHELEALRRGN